MSELTKLAVVVVKQELGWLLEASIPDLLFRPLERWMIGGYQMRRQAVILLED
jgi:hypothetical protein